jgi:phytoene dehydrogenase-like protein
MSNCEPSTTPAGQGLAYVYLPVFPAETNTAWQSHKSAAADAIAARCAEFYEGFDSELGRWFEACPDRALRAGVPAGSTSQVDFGAFRLNANRPAFGLGGPKPLTPGLFLGGASIHPGGGVSGMAGRLAARRVTGYLAGLRGKGRAKH